MHMIRPYLPFLSYPLLGDIDTCCKEIKIWYILLLILGVLIITSLEFFFSFGLFWSLYTGHLFSGDRQTLLVLAIVGTMGYFLNPVIIGEHSSH